MIIQINIKKLIRLKLSAEEYILLSIIEKEEPSLLYEYTSKQPKFYNKVLDHLVNSGYITKFDGVFMLQKSGREIITSKVELKLKEAIPSGKSIPEFVAEYRDLFPKGSPNGYPAKGDKNGCIKKMKKFLKDNPEYNEDIILTATKLYVAKKKMENYRYMKAADYFIIKDNISLLASYCEEITTSGETEEKKNTIDF